MTDKPKLLEGLKWIAAYPKVESRVEKVIWWSVFKTYFLRPAFWFLVGGIFWLVVPKMFGIDIAAHLHLPTRASKPEPKFTFDFDALQKVQKEEADRNTLVQIRLSKT